MNETRTQSDRDTLKSKAINWRKKRSNVDKNSWTQQKEAAADQAQKVAGVIEHASAEFGRHDQQIACPLYG